MSACDAACDLRGRSAPTRSHGAACRPGLAADASRPPVGASPSLTSCKKSPLTPSAHAPGQQHHLTKWPDSHCRSRHAMRMLL